MPTGALQKEQKDHTLYLLFKIIFSPIIVKSLVEENFYLLMLSVIVYRYNNFAFTYWKALPDEQDFVMQYYANKQELHFRKKVQPPKNPLSQNKRKTLN